MNDRVSLNPGRVLVTPENGGEAFYATLTRADNPTQEGDPLNKSTLLKDATAALFGLDDTAVPDDVLNRILAILQEQENLSLRAASRYSGFGSETQSVEVSGEIAIGDAEGTVNIPIPENAKLVFLSDINISYTSSGWGGGGGNPIYGFKGELIVNDVAYTVFEESGVVASNPDKAQESVKNAKFNIVQLIGRPAVSTDIVKFKVTTTLEQGGGSAYTYTWNSATINARYL